jgi:hypothetical protein
VLQQEEDIVLGNAVTIPIIGLKHNVGRVTLRRMKKNRITFTGWNLDPAPAPK